MHVALDPTLAVFLRPPSGPDIGLYPTGPGLGAAADLAVDAAGRALPFLLDKVAEQPATTCPARSAPSPPGSAMRWRCATTPTGHFTYPALDFGGRPVSALARCGRRHVHPRCRL